jgi:hypothetical protein
MKKGIRSMAILVPLLLAAEDIKSPSTWAAVRSGEGRFEVLMPEKLQATKSTVKTRIGDVEAFVFQSTGADRAYVLMYNDYPAALVRGNPAEALLDGAREGGLAKVAGGKLKAEQKIQRGGHPGRDLLIEVMGGRYFIRDRLYLVEGRLYQLIVAGPEEFVRGPDAGKFFDSFKLTPP